MATYAVSSGILVCTGTGITTQGIVNAVNANSGSLNSVGGSAASASTTLTEQGYRSSIINADFYIGDGSTASTWVAENESINVWANIIGFNNANVRFGVKNTNGTYGNPVFFSYDSTSNAGTPAGWERWQLLNGGHFEAYVSTIICDNLLTYEPTVGDVTFERCFLSIIDGLGDGSGTYGTTNSPTMKYIDCIIDSHVGVGLKLYQQINYVLNKVSITNNTFGIQPGQDSIVLVDPSLDTNNFHSVPNIADSDVTLINSDILTLRIKQYTSSDIHRLVQRFDYQAVDLSGSALSGVKVRIIDQNSDVVVNNEATDSSGRLSTLPTYSGIKCLQYKTYAGNTETVKANHTFLSYKYGYGLTSKNIVVQPNVDIQEVDFKLTDALITETTKATVDAYTQLETAEKIYDRSASHLEDNLGTYLDFIVTRSANQIELTNKTLVIDATASPVFAYSDPQVTIKASTYTGGATATTGSVTTLNGAILSGGTFDCDVNYQSGAGTTLTNVTVNGVLDFDTAGTYTLDGCTIAEVTNSSGGAITVSLTNGSTVTTNTGPNITLQQSVNITALNIIDGSRVQIYNVTKSAEIDNSVVSGGTGYSTSVNLLSASVDDGDTIRLRATYTSGTSAKSEALATGIIGITGLSFFTTQENDDTYNTLALDGSTITKFTADYVNDQVDISVGNDFTLAEFYAWWAYNLTTSQGIAEFFGGVTAVDEANFKINNTVVNIYLDNATATNISQTDNRRLYRADGSRPVTNPTSGSGGLDVEWRSSVTIAASESIQTNLTSILADTDELQQNQGNWLTATGFSTFNHATDQVTVATNNDKTGYSLTVSDKNDIVDRNWDEPYNQHTAAGTFGKLMDILRKANRAIEGEVTGTPTTTTFTSNITGYVTGAFDSEILVFVSGTINGEARPILNYNSTNGTFHFEEAWTQAPSSSDEFVILPYHIHPISEIQEGLSTQSSVDTIDLNVDDIKAKTDQLNFTGSDVHSVASNMRGTDGANTTAPDNAGITANGSAIAALNDISTEDVKTQADQALVDYDADTKSHVKPSIPI